MKHTLDYQRKDQKIPTCNSVELGDTVLHLDQFCPKSSWILIRVAEGFLIVAGITFFSQADTFGSLANPSRTLTQVLLTLKN